MFLLLLALLVPVRMFACDTREPLPALTLGNLVEQSNTFFTLIPMESFLPDQNRIASIWREENKKERGDQFESDIIECAKNTYPIIDYKVLPLIDSFLNIKREHGSKEEK